MHVFAIPGNVPNAFRTAPPTTYSTSVRRNDVLNEYKMLVTKKILHGSLLPHFTTTGSITKASQPNTPFKFVHDIWHIFYDKLRKIV
jgi:hypothetical protein